MRHPFAILLALALTPASSPAQHAAAGPEPLTPFAVAKARALFRDRLPCLGCHRLDGSGGRIGPDLTDVGARRPEAYIERMIADPQGTVPGTVMPRVPMPAEMRSLIVAYLSRADAARASPDAGARIPGATSVARPSDGAALYARYCAACHGLRGDGDGPNARFLPVRPTAHADATVMARRPDDTLFDAIHSGAWILGRSNLMPPFGETLTREEIRRLVAHIRTLCRCEGPAWSRDGRR